MCGNEGTWEGEGRIDSVIFASHAIIRESVQWHSAFITFIMYRRTNRRESFEPSQTSAQREHKLLR